MINCWVGIFFKKKKKWGAICSKIFKRDFHFSKKTEVFNFGWFKINRSERLVKRDSTLEILFREVISWAVFWSLLISFLISEEPPFTWHFTLNTQYFRLHILSLLSHILPQKKTSWRFGWLVMTIPIKHLQTTLLFTPYQRGILSSCNLDWKCLFLSAGSSTAQPNLTACRHCWSCHEYLWSWGRDELLSYLKNK